VDNEEDIGGYMITKNAFRYYAFGFHIYSEFELPELSNEDQVEATPEIVIKESDLCKYWNAKVKDNNYFVLEKEMVLFHVPNIAIFLIEKGESIYITPLSANKMDEIRLYLLGTCMGILLMQKRILPLHGSGIAIDGKVYAIVGDCGAGKSTLARAFLKKGYKLISDDIIPVRLNKDGNPIVIPTYPYQKLWLESLQAFEMTTNPYKPIAYREEKFSVPMEHKFETNSLPLAGIFELKKTDGEEIEIKEIRNLERLQILYNHTFRNTFLQPLDLLEWHLITTSKLTDWLTIYQIERPKSRFTAKELVELILNKHKGESDNE